MASADGTGESDGDIESIAPAPGLDDDSEETSPGSTGDIEDAAETDVAETPTDDEAVSGAAANASSDGGDKTQPAVLSLPDFDAARGATGDPGYLPLDGGVPAPSKYFANWPQRALTWHSVTDPDTNCARPGHSEIRYVNGLGITQQVRDPQLRFSGEISHFVVSDEQNVAAWVVACGEELELYVGTLEPTGRIIEPTLAWAGLNQLGIGPAGVQRGQPECHRTQRFRILNRLQHRDGTSSSQRRSFSHHGRSWRTC
ncbi:MAG: hypothetical protein ACKVIQ_03900 [Acidimicrobiales bacterium]